MLKNIGLYLASAALLGITVACNDDPEGYDTSVDYASTQITAFSLKSNSTVLNNLDSVYFSIDLNSARIYNADSLPYGTKTNRLQVELTTDNCSTVELHFPREGKSDSIVNYLTNPNDSIDFSLGAVKLHLISADKVATRDYYINVNVHKVVSDSLCWNLKSPESLPSAISTMSDQRTVEFNNKVYTFVTDGTTRASLNIADYPLAASTPTTFNFPFTPRLSTLTSTTTTLYILDQNGSLYSSIDGTSWNSCNQTWESITAPYGDTLLGIANLNGKLTHVSYPSGPTSTVEADFPISGNSAAIRYVTQWSPTAQIITVGGLKSNGETTRTAWAYDGSQWACIAESTPMNAEGISVFPYYCCKTDTNTWVASTTSVLVAMGGTRTDNTIVRTIYLSYDFGFNWTDAPVSMQLPTEMPLLYNSQAIIGNTTNHVSRAVKPITEWDTPYIYVYGGFTANNTLNTKVYQGAINRLKFKPIQ